MAVRLALIRVAPYTPAPQAQATAESSAGQLARSVELPDLMPQPAPIPRLPFAAICGLGALASVAGGVGMASSMGGSPDTLVGVGIALALLAGLCLAALAGPPLVTDDNWGLVVLGVSGVRTMAALGAMLVLVEVQGLDRKPAVYAMLAGTVVMLVAEAGAAVWLISRRDRQRVTVKDQLQNPAGLGPGSVDG